MKRLSLQDILYIHESVISEFGGLEGVRDMGLVTSAVEAPFQTFDGIPLFPSVAEKAARLAFGLVCNHGFVDGNKRVGCTALIVFLSLNHVEFDPDLQELEDIFLGLADGLISYHDFLNWLVKHM